MSWTVLIAHAPGEEAWAERLAEPIRGAGYDVHHQGLVKIGESLVGEASNLLGTGGPVVLCGTERAAGSKWARRLVQAARSRPDTRVFVVQMEEDADVEPLSFGDKVAPYYRDPETALNDLVEALRQAYPLDSAADKDSLAPGTERRYWELALAACDIIDLANLPEDRHLAIRRRLELRRLYVPLRIQLSPLEISRVEKRGEKVEAFWTKKAAPIGELLAEARWLVILGDPGAGKSTLLRWLATAYLLRLQKDQDLKDLPDVATLPQENWLPVLVRCRDLAPSSLSGSLEDVLLHALRKTEMERQEIGSFLAHLRRKMVHGEVLLLIDGLDEIPETRARLRFCRQIERVGIAYPSMPIVVTSRIVGYREMDYRLGLLFQHATVAGLSSEDKDEFARRWCALTELPDRQAQATEELIRAIHSTERIERLVENPMLLTTLALVKRKVGKLPRRRADLYWEAVQVLLNWRSEVDEPIDFWEALPQLEYVAYAMCERGVQRLRQDEILELLEAVRRDYPQMHAIHARSPGETLRILERRTGILAEIGEERHLGMVIPAYEFRHLSFQEYLAARALVDGCFPGRDRSRSLAQQVASIASIDPREKRTRQARQSDSSWQETLRLCVICCRTDEVDEVLLAILTPKPEDRKMTQRQRAVLAALCLADEPNVSVGVARMVLQSLVGMVSVTSSLKSEAIIRFLQLREAAEEVKEPLPLEATARYKVGYTESRSRSFSSVLFDGDALHALKDSRWEPLLEEVLLEEFRQARSEDRSRLGALLGNQVKYAWHLERFKNLDHPGAPGGPEDESILAALAFVEVVESLQPVPEIWLHIAAMQARRGLRLLTGSAPAAFSGAWLLDRMHRRHLWKPMPAEGRELVSVIHDPAADPVVVKFLAKILGEEREVSAVQPLLAWLGTENHDLHLTLIEALGQIGDPLSLVALHTRLASQVSDIRLAAVKALAQISDERSLEPLLDALPRATENFDNELVIIVETLGRLGHPLAANPLSVLLQHPFQAVQVAAIEALGLIGEPRSVEFLEEFLEHPNRGVCEAASKALGRLESPGALKLLRSKLSVEAAWRRAVALGGLAQGWDELDRKLLSRNFDGEFPFWDPDKAITPLYMDRAARKLELPREEVRGRLERVAEIVPLRLV